MRRKVFAAVALAGVIVTTVAAGSSRFFEPSGQQFRYFGDARDWTDPQNRGENDVVRFDTTSGEPVRMTRKVRELVRELDNQLEFKYYMKDRNCGAGSPRIDLALDTNDDGRRDAFLEGHVQPDFLCPVQNTWVYQDLTDDLPRWGSRGLPGGPGNVYAPWSAVETAFGGVEVLYGMLVEDSQAFKVDNRGIAFYDLVSIGNRTYEDHRDSARNEG
jgi:hypothetical protein